ncbi:unnamed protein product [Gongylonema pulchrum]|uniref:PDZ domain-containing protein n=1 Tax=Gongylonema pulchrum TaxID=637853 RepID=A0A183DNU3_9BILA|nr:unnamed protein product [Gongylonema pulchrum]
MFQAQARRKPIKFNPQSYGVPICGSLHCGDRILAIDHIILDSCTVEEAMRLLQRSSEIVKLRVRKAGAPEQNSEDAVKTLIYSIELSRKGGPLGITIASSGERNEAVLISHLTPGGLAERTGALRVGDHILAVNNESVEGMKAADVMYLLQKSTDYVTIKILRNFDSFPAPGLWQSSPQTDKTRLHHSAAMSDCYSEISDKLGTPVQSTDSAVESLDDSAGNIAKFSNVTHYVFDEQLANTSLNYGSYNSDQALWGNDLSRINECAPRKRCNCHRNAEFEQDSWVKILEALETVGEAEMLQKLEECTVGSVSAVYGHGSPLIASHHEAAIAQRIDLRLPLANSVGRQSHRFSSSAGSALVRGSLSPSVKPNFSEIKAQKTRYSSTDIMDSSSLSNDSQTSASLGDIPYQIAPPKPPRFGALGSQALLVLSEPLNGNISECLSQCSTNELQRDPRTNSFGFSVSDGVGSNPGVFINAILPGGAADLCGQILPYDKILQARYFNSHALYLLLLSKQFLLAYADSAPDFIFPLDISLAFGVALYLVIFDINKVNGTSLQYLDCDLALPLMNVAEIEMLLYREPVSSNACDDEADCRSSVNLSLHDSAV